MKHLKKLMRMMKMNKKLVIKWVEEAFQFGAGTEMEPNEAFEDLEKLKNRIDKYFKRKGRK
jgi:hypothetical protein